MTHTPICPRLWDKPSLFLGTTRGSYWGQMRSDTAQANLSELPLSRPRVRRQGWTSWIVPGLAVLLGLTLLEATLHARWLELVWGVRGLPPELWSSGFTRARLWLDGANLMLGAVSAALFLRYSIRGGKYAIVVALFALGALESGLPGAAWNSATTATSLLLGLLPLFTLLGLGVLLYAALRKSRWLRVGYLWTVALTLLWMLGFLPLEGSGLPTPLFGSRGLAVLWNELLRPTVRDLAFVALLVCAALAWLERSPDTLRSSAARFLALSGLFVSGAALYTLVVGGVGSLLHAENSFLLSVTAAALLAVALQPLRVSLERGIHRLLYGERDDPYAVIERLLGQLEGSLEPRASLQNALNSVAETLRLPYIAVQLSGGETLSYGHPATHCESLALVAQGERIGTLEVGRRAGRERFSSADLRLMGSLAAQLASAAHAWQLGERLRDSRENLVRAGEEERRRLRRDLHDGLGPSLSGLGLKLEAARMLLLRSPEKAEAHLSALKLEVQESVNEVRRLVHDLRPPKLDDLGLIGALEELLKGAQDVGLMTRFERPHSHALPTLPAAVEVALYRIAQEALTNVQKHARAAHVRLSLALEGSILTLELEDDGVGLPRIRTPGVGSQSMRERAEALSGTLELQRGEAGGTLVRASLPMLGGE